MMYGRPFISELTLTTTVTTCRSKEAAKKPVTDDSSGARDRDGSSN